MRRGGQIGKCARLSRNFVATGLFFAALCCVPSLSRAIEGSSTAGPIGGADIRSAQLPPPGLYYGTVQLYAVANRFFGSDGAPVPALNALEIERFRAGPFLLFVPDIQLFGGSIGFFGDVPAGTECGRMFAATPRRCISGVGDPYVEAAWSRFFGTVRKSQYPSAPPILEGLTVLFGFGTVIPIGYFSVKDATANGLVIGNNIWDFAPTVAVTYVTQPILAEGTEFSAKFYWNNYLTDPATHYWTSPVLDVDFAVSEHIGKFQVGMAGYYAFQYQNDQLYGAPVKPIRRGEVLTLGPVLAYDMPEYNSFLKIKVLTTVVTINTVQSWGVVIGWAKKF